MGVRWDRVSSVILLISVVSLLIPFANMQPAFAVDFLPPFAVVSTGTPPFSELHTRSPPAPFVEMFPDPSKPITKIYATVTPGVTDASLFFEIDGVGYTKDIPPLSDTLITFAVPSPQFVTNVFMTYSGSGPTDTIDVGYEYGSTQIKITKNSSGVEGAFNFTISNFTNIIPLDIPNTTDFNMTLPVNVTAGFYNVTEIQSIFWNQTNSNCLINNVEQNTTTNVNVTNNDFVECIFTNEPISPALLKITKNATGGDDAFEFEMTNSSGIFTVEIPDTSINNMTEQFTIGAGIHNVTEIVTPGWNLISSDCLVNGFSVGTTTNVIVNPGDGVECIFENELIPAINQTTLKITKNTIDGNGEFNFTVIQENRTGNIIITDPVTKLVEVYNSAGTFLFSFNGSDSSGIFNNPNGVTVEDSGNIIVSDTGNNKIKVFSSNGTFIREFNGTGSSGVFSNPEQVAVDSSGNIIVADRFNNLIKVFTSTGTFVRELDGTGSGEVFSQPRGVEVDSTDNIIVADQDNGKVKIFTSTGGFIREFDGTGSSGVFNNPRGIGVDSSGNIYVAEGAALNNKIKVFTSTGTFIRELDGTGSSGSFSLAAAVTTDISGRIYVADSISGGNFKVFDSNGGFLFEVAGTTTDVAIDSSATLTVASIPDTSTNNMYGPVTITPGTFNVTETVPAGWNLTSSDCTINGASQGATTNLNVSSGDTVVCTFTDKRTTLKIIKNTTNGDGAFDFNILHGASGTNHLIVADGHSTNKLRVFDAETEGGFLFEFNGAGAPSGPFFSGPSGVAQDSSGNIYAISTMSGGSSQKVSVYDNTGTFLFEFDGSGSSDTFDLGTAQGITVDSLERIIVADSGNAKVKVFNSAGLFLFEFDGTGSPSGPFVFPTDVAVDSSNRIHVNDRSDNLVKIYDSTGAFLFELDGTGSSGAFSNPVDIAVGDNRIIVADLDNDLVKVFNSAGTFLFEFDGSDSSGVFINLAGVDVDKSGSIYVTDTSTDKLKVFSSAGIFSYEIDSIGSGLGADFENPNDVSVDVSGTEITASIPDTSTNNMFGPIEIDPGELDVTETVPDGWTLTDSDCTINGIAQGKTTELQISAGDEVICTFTDKRTTLKITKNTAGGNGTFAFDVNVRSGTGNIVVSDRDNNLIKVFNSNGTFLFEFNGTDSSGTFSGFFSPKEVAVDSNGRILVVDGNSDRVKVFSNTGTFLFEFRGIGASEIFLAPLGVAVDSSDNIYVTDAGPIDEVKVYNSTGSFLFEFNGTGTAFGQFSQPNGLAIDSNGRIIVGDDFIDFVKVFNSTGSFLFEFNGAGSSGNFNGPTDVAVDRDDNIIVVDFSNARIKVFNSTGGFIREFDGTGSSGVFNAPNAVDVDGLDNIFVADRDNNRIKVFSSTGAFLFEFNGTDSSGIFNVPHGVAVDSRLTEISANITDTSTNNMYGPVVIPTGILNVTETVPAGWTLTSSDCTINGIAQNTTTSINVTAGDAVVCTFNNTFSIVPTTLKITKNTTNGDGAFNFTYTNSSGSFELNIADTSASNMSDTVNITPGTYNVTETVPAGWNQTSADCSVNSVSVGTTTNVNVTSGDAVECVFNNTRILNATTTSLNATLGATDSVVAVRVIGTVAPSVTLPSGVAGAVSIQNVTVSDPTTSGNSISFLGTTYDYTFSSSNLCDSGCTIEFTFTQADLDAAGITLASATIFEDPEEDGTFVALATTITDGAPSPFTVQATTTSSGTTFGVGSVSDTTKPAITLVGNNPQEIVVGNAYTELGATATDDVDGDITGSIVIDASAVNTAVVASYSVTYDVSDAAGNAADQVTRTVNVIASDTTAPVVTTPSDQTVTSTGSSTVNFAASAIDNVDGSITPSCLPPSGSVFLPGTTTVTCSATDSAGNTGQATFSITVGTGSQLAGLTSEARISGAGGPCPESGSPTQKCVKLSANP